MWAAGADGCRAGWLAVFRCLDGQEPRARIFDSLDHVFSAIEHLSAAKQGSACSDVVLAGMRDRAGKFCAAEKDKPANVQHLGQDSRSGCHRPPVQGHDLRMSSGGELLRNERWSRHEASQEGLASKKS